MRLTRPPARREVSEMATGAELQKDKETLRLQGLTLEITTVAPRKAIWYRADGTPLPIPLPTDRYHCKRFWAKGWTLKPPVASSPASVQMVVEGTGSDLKVIVKQHVH